MYVLLIDPLVVQVQVPLPFDEILQFPSSADSVQVQNLLDFILLLVFDQVWRWSRIIWSVKCRLMVGCEKIDMEYVMNTPLCGKFSLIVDGGHHLNDGKWTVSLGRKLYHRLISS